MTGVQFPVWQQHLRAKVDSLGLLWVGVLLREHTAAFPRDHFLLLGLPQACFPKRTFQWVSSRRVPSCLVFGRRFLQAVSFLMALLPLLEVHQRLYPLFFRTQPHSMR